MAPNWLTVVAWVYLSVCLCCAGIITYDIAVDHRRQPMGVMNFVYPITALYFGPFWLAITIAGATLGAEYVGDYVLALAFGIIFQYFAIAPMRGLGLKDGLIAAAKADFISLTAFEAGLFGWMAVMAFVLFPAPHQLMPNSVAFWLLMQIGMIIGFAISWPANVWLVNRGIKVPM